MIGSTQCFIIHTLASWPPARVCVAILTDKNDSNKGLELVDRGFRLGHYRRAAEDPRFTIVPPVYCELENNYAHLAPLRIDGQTPRPSKKGKSSAKR